jgi:hypothetical protein
MKLEQNQKPLNAGEGLSLKEIYARGCRAHFEGRVEAGNAYFCQLQPRHGDVYIRAYGFLSQLLSFRRDFDQAWDYVRFVMLCCPGNPLAMHYAELVLCYRKEYDEAARLHWSYSPPPEDIGSYNYLSARILAGLGDYQSSIFALNTSLECNVHHYARKIWYDPEITSLWDAMPSILLLPNVEEIFEKPHWQVLLDSYDPHAPFDDLDPGNLRSLSLEEMRFIGVHPNGPHGFIVEERASEAPEAYATILNYLTARRELSMTCLFILID